MGRSSERLRYAPRSPTSCRLLALDVEAVLAWASEAEHLDPPGEVVCRPRLALAREFRNERSDEVGKRLLWRRGWVVATERVLFLPRGGSTAFLDSCADVRPLARLRGASLCDDRASPASFDQARVLAQAKE